MTRWIVAYVAALAAVCALDFLWLGVVARDFYRGQIGALLLDQPRFGAAGLFYAMYAAAIVFFAVASADASGGWLRAVAQGAILGFVCYATYDFSNLATLKGWSATVVVVDIVWGIAITATASVASFAALRAAT
jgi:uncharacterized membrane protein